MDKERKKILRRSIGWFFIKSSVSVSGGMPLYLNCLIGRVLGSLAYFILTPHRRVALGGLAMAMPDLTPNERRGITRKFFAFMAETSFELLYYLRNINELEMRVSVSGKECLDKALSVGKGVIIVSAHIGNFPLMSLKLASMGYPVHFVTRPMRDERAGQYLHDLRREAGVKTIFSYPRRECVNGILKALGSNEIVILQMDQNFGTGGVWVKFFGKLAATPQGPVTMSIRSGAKLVPAYIYKSETGLHHLKIMPQHDIHNTKVKDETVLKNVILMTRIIEGWVRKHPHQWGWIHRRWKSRPSKKILSLPYRVEQDEGT